MESRCPEEDLGEAMNDDESQFERAMARKGKAAEEDRLMEASLRGPLGNSATHVEWRSQMHAIKGWSRPTFKRRLKGFKQRHPELTGRDGRTILIRCRHSRLRPWQSWWLHFERGLFRLFQADLR
jgi:hypothetical protein